MILAITLPSLLLALSVLFRWPLLIPSGLFESTAQPMPELARASSPTITRPWSHEYKRSGSVTVVEGRRSGDVWVTNGDAIDGKSKVGRAFEMLNAKPKLSILPVENVVKSIDGELTPLCLSRVPLTLSLLRIFLDFFLVEYVFCIIIVTLADSSRTGRL
jgi:hypothetical protein